MGHNTFRANSEVLSLSFPTMFSWAIVKSCIRPIFIDNVLILELVVLVASILDGYDID